MNRTYQSCKRRLHTGPVLLVLGPNLVDVSRQAVKPVTFDIIVNLSNYTAFCTFHMCSVAVKNYRGVGKRNVDSDSMLVLGELQAVKCLGCGIGVLDGAINLHHSRWEMTMKYNVDTGLDCSNYIGTH